MSSSSESSSSDTSSSNESSDSRSQHHRRKSKSKRHRKSAKKQRKAKSAKKYKKRRDDSTESEKNELTWDRVVQIIEEEGLEQALRLDAYSLMVNSIYNSKLKKKQNHELFEIMKQYLRVQDSSILLTRILAHTEDMIQFFILDNFSNKDQVVLNSLRSQRNPDYF